MMPSDRTDDERALPRRDYGDPKCASPFCDRFVRVRGEFCNSCRDQQERHKAAMRHASGKAPEVKEQRW